ncbi:hypothetical protein [Natronosalvus halobius]|uniref:hypothetical protein n=1 Tax=Natronosalvus halobius TaxID=2953746 RepID=UPI0020A09CEA|nr:hypothetical protein [Natronosalvus halobius]USZ71268.1 hypothetical protein NGM15_14475 [Natronosalvus halobius]
MDEPTDQPQESRLSADRETIRRWADEHTATPVRHEDEPDRYRILPESETMGSHETVEWDDFFGRLDEGDQVVIYHGTEASDPFEVTRREEALTRSSVDREDLKERLLEGETVTTEITETTVVESVVVEETSIESELVDTEVIDESVVDVELLQRECTGCTLVDEGGSDRDHADWFDEDRYYDAVDRTGSEPVPADTGAGSIESTTDVPYSAELDVEEMWSVTREFTERFTVESHVAGTDVVETDTVEDRDIDIEGLQRTIAESNLLDVDVSTDNVLTEYEIESEVREDNRIHTYFTREHVVEDEVVDRKRLYADVTGGELLAMETVHTEDIVTEESGTMPTGTTEGGVVEGAEGESMGATEEEPMGATEEEPMGATEGEPMGATEGEPMGASEGEFTEGAERVTLSDDEIGKAVVDTAGEELGMVTDVEDGGETMYVDAHPGITEKIKAALDWGDVNDDAFPVDATEIERVTDDQVVLKGAEELGSDENSM